MTEVHRTQRGERARWLEQIARRLRDAAPELVAIAESETALPPPRLEGEVERTAFQLEHLAGALRDPSFLPDLSDDRSTHPAGPQVPMLRTWEPLGRVLVFTAGNFPFAFSIAGNDVASALAAGCPVTVKAHPGHVDVSRATRTLVDDVLSDLQAPAGTFQYLESEHDALDLVRTGDLGAVAFTGSRGAGRMLYDECAARPTPIPMYGELASVNPVVVTSEAITQGGDAIAQGLVESFTLGVGQFCTKPGLVFVPSGSDLLPEVLRRLAEVPPRRMLEQRFADRFRHRLAEMKLSSLGVLHVPGGRSHSVQDREALPAILETTATTFLDHQNSMSEECFGPLTVLVSYGSAAELHQCLAALDGQLTATIHAGDGDDRATLQALVNVLARRAGRIIWNGWPTGVGIGAAMTHGGPYPSATTPTSSIGSSAISRFLRPVTYQGTPPSAVVSWSSGMEAPV